MLSVLWFGIMFLDRSFILWCARYLLQPSMVTASKDVHTDLNSLLADLNSVLLIGARSCCLIIIIFHSDDKVCSFDINVVFCDHSVRKWIEIICLGSNEGEIIEL